MKVEELQTYQEVVQPYAKKEGLSICCWEMDSVWLMMPKYSHIMRLVHL